MTNAARKAPWIPARSAQVAIAAAAVADTFRAAAVRDHNLHHTDASPPKSGFTTRGGRQGPACPRAPRPVTGVVLGEIRATAPRHR